MEGLELLMRQAAAAVFTSDDHYTFYLAFALDMHDILYCNYLLYQHYQFNNSASANKDKHFITVTRTFYNSNY